VARLCGGKKGLFGPDRARGGKKERGERKELERFGGKKALSAGVCNQKSRRKKRGKINNTTEY